jgi:2-oxo-4-hydroxy-4-carboxy-5-ureidoimidazoline decarboxylase
MGHSAMTDAHAILNAATREEAAALLARCCGSSRWVEGMLERRPFASRAALDDAADEVWARMTPKDFIEAFGHHPRIGSRGEPPAERHKPTADWSREEQSAASHTDASTTKALRQANLAYEERFGFVFLVCATGRSAPEMLRSLDARLQNDAETELSIAAAEQAKITRLRLEKIAR